MRVCFDVQAALAQRAGVGRYARNLAISLADGAGVDALRLFCFDFRGRAGAALPAVSGLLDCVRVIPGRVPPLLWKHLGWPPFNWFAGGADVYHFPNFTAPPVTRGRTVVTIHDMSFLRYPEFAEEKNLRYLRARLPRTVSAAAGVVTVSKFSADEICEFLPVSRDRVFVTYPGVDASFRRVPVELRGPVLAGYGLDRPYLLAVGTLEPRKNYGFLVDVFERLTRYDGLLVIAGLRGWKCEPILERLARSRVAGRIRHLGDVKDEDMPALYSGADALIMPSHYEGFGFPPLEAMACGTPVLVSGGGSLPEVVGDGAVVLRDFDAGQWADEVERLLSGDANRAALTQRGCARAGLYRWSTTAAETWKVYREVHDGG